MQQTMLENIIVGSAFIDGEVFRDSHESSFPAIDPSTGEAIADIPVADNAAVQAAVASSRQAFRRWRHSSPVDRVRILYSISDHLRTNRKMLSVIESINSGKPLREAESDVEVAARYFEYYAGAADKIHGETIPIGSGHLAYTELEPVGVTAHIVPWNFPLTQAARGLAPAIAVGASAILKPAEQTPLTALLLARIMSDAGLPKGVCNVICGPGSLTGALLTSHAHVDHVTFTGSVDTGKAVMKAAAEHMASVTLELGGKSPVVVMDDADLDRALAGVMRGIFTNCGQVCSAGSRLILHRAVSEQFLEKLRETATKLTIGRGLDNPDLGPLVSVQQRTKVAKMVDEAKNEGARIMCGGDIASPKGYEAGFYYKPTILIVDDPASAAAQDEFFGPVLVVQIADCFEDAVELSENSSYGLVAGIYTASSMRANRYAREIRAGQVFVNGYLAGGVETPFGGFKMSGIGREKGLEGLRSYTNSKTVIHSF